VRVLPPSPPLMQFNDWAGGVSMLGANTVLCCATSTCLRIASHHTTTCFVIDFQRHLGLGDIVLPGFLVAVAARADVFAESEL
jgi:acyl-coenzyme A thioesterase PaaI-like protein